MIIKEKIINNVIGFNLKADIYNIDGSIISTKVRTILPPTVTVERRYIKDVNKKFFTNFNDTLLEKLKDYKRING